MNRLHATGQLNATDVLLSDNGLVKLVLQGDGNLVLYRAHFGQALWASNTMGKGVNRVVMQPDGNLVAYSAAGVPEWATGTAGNPGASTPSTGRCIRAGDAPTSR